MKRKGLLLGSLLLAFSLTACDSGYSRQPSADSAAPSSAPTASGSQAPAVPSSVPEQENGRADTGRRISVTSEEGHVLVFALHDSTAADELYRQLPLSVPVENYGSREKIFYPPEELDVGDSPPAQGPAGTLAYYAPWGNVAIFYGTCEGADGLYQLGEVVSGEEYMAELTGDVRIEAADVSAASTGTAGGASASSGQTPPAEPSSEDSRSVPAGADRAEENAAVKMHVQVGDATFTATLENNGRRL